ncbi:MAG: hypothetical protein KME04_04705 [Pleurocapsa minor GSE-CHR-MK-17-07R]|jgi:hypothetical protein|nr:hypothetical protein [Pleurocapsa minor GSE-CHR-MK 17-07R]
MRLHNTMRFRAPLSLERALDVAVEALNMIGALPLAAAESIALPGIAPTPHTVVLEATMPSTRMSRGELLNVAITPLENSVQIDIVSASADENARADYNKNAQNLQSFANNFRFVMTGFRPAGDGEAQP